MSVSSGFFNSSNLHDRLYDATDFGRMFDGVITDGVFAGFGEVFLVQKTGAWTVSVGSGRAWFNHTWTYNDGPITLNINTASAGADRYDYVVLEVNLSDNVRANTIKVVNNGGTNYTGTYNVGSGIYQYLLAKILVPRNSAELSASNITMLIGVADTGSHHYAPYAKAAVDNLDISALMQGYDNQFMAWWNQLNTEIGSDVAGGLLNQINRLRGDVSPLFQTRSYRATYNIAANKGATVGFGTTGIVGYSIVGVVAANTGNPNVAICTFNPSGMYLRNLGTDYSSQGNAEITVLYIRNVPSS